MSAHAHRGRYRKFIGLAVASAAGGLVIAGPVLAGKPDQPKRDVLVTKVASVASVVPGGSVQYDITVKNTGDLPIPYALLTVVDPMADSDPVFVEPDGEEKGKNLKTGETALFRATKTFSSDIAQCGTTVQNTAFAIVEPKGQQDEEEVEEKQEKGKKPNAKSQRQRKAATARKAANAANEFPWVVKSASAGVLVEGGTCPVPPPVVPTAVTGTPAPVTALRPAALNIAKTGPARMLAGGFARFQITVTNTGQTDATNVVLSDLPPRALLWRSVPTGATVSGRNAEWNLGTLGAGQSVTKTVSFRARLSASGRVCNVATVSSAQAGAGVDRACVTVAAARRPATPVTG